MLPGRESRRVAIVGVLVGVLSLAPSPARGASRVSAAANPTAGTNLVDNSRFAGRVVSMVEAAGRLYLAGEFTGIRSPAADGGVFDGTTGASVAGFPRIGDGVVKAAVADGSGGWYVAGTFTVVEGAPRAGTARLLADGSLGGWNPDVSPPGTVKALALGFGGRVYLGGDFSAVDGVDRPGVAAVDGQSGGVDPAFVPALGPSVVRALALSVDGGRLYAGGRVDPGDGRSRRGLAALETASGAASPWNPDVVGRVDTIAVAPADGKVYIGGDFKRVAGVARSYVARLDPATGAVDDWGPEPNAAVSALAVSGDGSRLFVGGSFSALGPAKHRHFAAVDVAAGTPVAGWDPAPDAPVAALALAPGGAYLYAGGTFAAVGGAARPGLAALDAGSGALVADWQPDGGGAVEVVSPSGTLVLAGGRFDRVVERPKAYLAALHVDGGALDTSFGPEADAPVRALALSPDGARLYAGGEFTTIGGASRSGVAVIDVATGTVDPTFVPPAPDGPVQAVAVSPDGLRLYIGGAFDSLATSAGPQARPAHLAALDAATGALLAGWSPPRDAGGAFTGQTGRPTAGVTSEINALALSSDGGRVYAGGTFVDIGGRAGLVALDAGSGQPSAWQPEMERPINSIFESPADGRTFYVATGGFGGTVQAFDPSGSARPVWERRTDGDATAVVASATTVYLGGHFDYVCDSCGSTGGPGDDFRRHVAAFDAATGNLDPWAPVANTKTGPYCAALGADHVYIGGEFTRINNLPQPGVAQFPGVP